MHITEGQRVLDLGCGPGSDTLALAALVGDSGAVDGVDYDAGMIDEADARAAAAGVADRVTHRQADASALPDDDGVFDACRSERVFQHLPDPAAALAEMIRVTRPGGRIVVLDSDDGSASIATEVPSVERQLLDHARTMINSPDAARSLYRAFTTAGCTDVTVEVLPIVVDDLDMFREMFLLERMLGDAEAVGAIAAEDARAFRADLEAAAAIDAFFASTQQMLVAGTTPTVTRGS